MPKLPNPPPIQMPQSAPPPPMFGQQPAGAALRTKAQADRSKAFGGSLLGSQLQTAQTAGKTLLGQAG